MLKYCDLRTLGVGVSGCPQSLCEPCGAAALTQPIDGVSDDEWKRKAASHVGLYLSTQRNKG